MNAMADARLVTHLGHDFAVKVELDDRAFLFPAGKPVIHLVFSTNGKLIHVEAVFPFNASRTPPRLLSLDLEDARELGRRLVEAVHQARSQLAITSSMRVAINVVANGYHLQIGDMNQATDLYLSAGCIWRVCQGILRITDHIAPIESN